MKRKNTAGLIAIIMIVSIAIFPIHAEIEEANTSDHLLGGESLTTYTMRQKRN